MNYNIDVRIFCVLRLEASYEKKHMHHINGIYYDDNA